MQASKNETTVTTGILAGAAATIMWWILREAAGIDAPSEIVAASVAILTAALQYFVPAKKEPANAL